MKQAIHSEPDTTPSTVQKGQVNDKPAKRVRSRSGQGTLAYWRERLFRNSYTDRDGQRVEIPEFYVRMRHGGITKRVRLHSAEKDRAAEMALRLAERLSVEGWAAVTAGQARLPASPSIVEFGEAYVKASRSFEHPPRQITVKLYLRHLRQICALGGVSRIRELTPEAIERARDKYRASARAAKRNEASIQNSLGIILRNAAACFSAESRAILARQGLALDNPFVGVKRSQRIEPVAALDRKVIERIWRDLPLLRDGDSAAEEPNLEQFKRGYRRKHAGHKPRWLPVDYRKPHPEAYCAILLGLGLGLRANEIDKARWSWVKFSEQGEAFLEIRSEDDFEPKGGSLRVIRLPQELHEELTKCRRDAGSPYILGGMPSRAVERNGFGYRRREILRVVHHWLRERGVEAGEARSNPLHRLRKQFGSEVATGFGLFAAQKLLGHSSPTVTAKYYAAQTELPTLTHVRILG